MRGRNIFTGSSSFSSNPNNSRQNTSQSSSPNTRSQNTFQNLFGRTTETFHFGIIQITAPYSERLKFQKLQENIFPESRALIHNIHSYKQHFERSNVYGGFSIL